MYFYFPRENSYLLRSLSSVVFRESKLCLKYFLNSACFNFNFIHNERVDNSVSNIQPDPYLIEQAKQVLVDMMDSNIMNDINNWYLNGSLPSIVSVDKVFNSQKDRAVNVKNRPRSNVANQYVSVEKSKFIITKCKF